MSFKLLKRKMCLWVACQVKPIVIRILKASIEPCRYPMGIMVFACNYDKRFGGKTSLRLFEKVEETEISNHHPRLVIICDDKRLAGDDFLEVSFHFFVPNVSGQPPPEPKANGGWLRRRVGPVLTLYRCTKSECVQYESWLLPAPVLGLTHKSTSSELFVFSGLR